MAPPIKLPLKDIISVNLLITIVIKVSYEIWNTKTLYLFIFHFKFEQNNYGYPVNHIYKPMNIVLLLVEENNYLQISLKRDNEIFR